jgi:hypothetical protein
MRAFAALIALALLLASCMPGVDATVTEVAGVQAISLTLPASEPSQPLGLDLTGAEVVVIDSGGGECAPSEVVPNVTQCFFELVVVEVPLTITASGVDTCRFWTVIGIKSFPCILEGN